MNKIDLSKAKLGDKFITKEGRILTLAYQGRKYTLIGSGCFVRLNKNGKLYEDNEESKFDLIEQVFENGDILDIGERGEVLAEMTKSEFEKARELGIDFLDVYIEKNPEEDNQELKRRQEVIALAEKLVVNEEMMKAHRGLFEAEVHTHAKAPTSYSAFVIRSAEEFVKCKEKYLNAGNV